MQHTDKARAEFEAWLLREHGLDGTWDESRNCYKEFPAHLAFHAWKDSPSAQVVTLPKPYGKPSITAHPEYAEFNRAISDCRAAIVAAGLTVKE